MMTKKTENKYFTITPEKEREDILKLASAIATDNWMDDDTLIVNCSPDYSSIVSTVINHHLSILNKEELYSSLSLQMPYPNMSQVWNPEEDRWELYDTYLEKWINKYILYSKKFLFIDSGILRGKNFNKLKLSLRSKIDRENYKFASLYVQSSSILKPDYYVEEFDMEKDGGLLFWWENKNNPNWDY